MTARTSGIALDALALLQLGKLAGRAEGAGEPHHGVLSATGSTGVHASPSSLMGGRNSWTQQFASPHQRRYCKAKSSVANGP